LLQNAGAEKLKGAYFEFSQASGITLFFLQNILFEIK